MQAEVHQKKRDLRQRLMNVLRVLAEKQRHPKHGQILMDLACKLMDTSSPIDPTRLPMTPDGFVVRCTTWEKLRGISTRTICELQVVSMTVLYYWLYAATHDAQDLRSCEHYMGWLDEYVSKSSDYTPILSFNRELYLYPLKGIPGEKPHTPYWLKENNGETV